jgi:hypothetical protein
MSEKLPAPARKLLREAVERLRAQLWSMGEEEMKHPTVRRDLRLADRIERYLEKN